MACLTDRLIERLIDWNKHPVTVIETLFRQAEHWYLRAE